MALLAELNIPKITTPRQLRFTSFTVLVMTVVALIVLAQNYYKHAGDEFYSVKLSLIYNLIVYASFALTTPLILKLADRFPLSEGKWHWRFGRHLVFSLLIVLAHMLFCNVLLYAIDLSSSIIFPRFLAKYLTNVVHIHLIVYWAILLLVTFYRDWYSNKPANTSNEEQSLERFQIRENGRSFYLDFHRVYWIEANDHYQKLHTADGYHLIKSSMMKLEESLPGEVFKRAHRSYFINVNHLKAVRRDKTDSKLFLEMEGGTSLALGRSYRDNFPR